MIENISINKKRWIVTCSAIGINLALGVLYTWSVIKKAIPSEWGWSDADKALPYSVACIVFSLIMVPAGRLQDKFGPRWIAYAGGIFTGLGFIIASYATSVFWFVIGFGLFAGLGIGLGYASATPAAVKWFPSSKTGFIAGLVVAGFGLASVYISPLANYLTGFSVTGKPLPEVVELSKAKELADKEYEALQRAMASMQSNPSGFDIYDVRLQITTKELVKKDVSEQLLRLKERNIHRTMLFFGIGFLVVVTLFAQFLSVPPHGYKPPDDIQSKTSSKANFTIEIGPLELLKSPLFYVLWLMFAFSAGAGLMIIGNITTIAKIGNIEAGFILVAMLAIGNASGRIIAGILSDKIGRLWTMFIAFSFQAILMLVLKVGLSELTTFVIISMLLGFNYGACLALFPSAVKDYFGIKNFGVNYGIVFTSWGVGGFIFPVLAGNMYESAKHTSGVGSYENAYLLAATVLAVASALVFLARIIEHRHKAKYIKVSAG